MIPTEKELFEKLEEELHRAALPPVELTMLGELENPLERACAHWERLDPFGGPGAPNVTEVVLDFLAEENLNYRDGLLYERMSNEYAAYLDEVREKDPQTIMDNAYQIIIKEDILSLMEGHDLELPQIDVLLTLKCPLDALYWEWLDNDYSHMDMLRDTLDSFVERERKALVSHARDENGEVPERLRDYYATYEADPEPSCEEEDLER